MCRPCGTFRCVVCRIVLPGFRPCRDVGDVRGARCVMISAEVEPPQCGVIVVEPPQCDGSTAFAAARSCRECRGFRCSLRPQRNGGGRRREQGEQRASGERNLPIYDLKSKVLRLKSNVFILHSQLPYILPTSCCRCVR